MKSEKEIFEQVDNFVKEKTLFVGGLLRIFRNPETGKYVSGVIDELPEDFGDLVGIFPNKTLKFALENYTSARSRNLKNIKFSIYVEDLKVPAEQKDKFLTEFQPPLRFQKALVEYNMNDDDFIGQVKNRFICESILKEKGSKILSINKLKEGDEDILYTITAGNNSCNLSSQGRLRLADEIIMFLEFAYTNGFKNVVAYWPKSCELPLNHGAKLVPEIFGYKDLRVLFIYLDPDCNFPADFFYLG